MRAYRPLRFQDVNHKELSGGVFMSRKLSNHRFIVTRVISAVIHLNVSNNQPLVMLAECHNTITRPLPVEIKYCLSISLPAWNDRNYGRDLAPAQHDVIAFSRFNSVALHICDADSWENNKCADTYSLYRKHACTHECTHTHRHRQTHVQTNRHRQTDTDRQTRTDRHRQKTDRQTDRQTDRHTHTHTHMHTHTHTHPHTH